MITRAIIEVILDLSSFDCIKYGTKKMKVNAIMIRTM